MCEKKNKKKTTNEKQRSKENDTVDDHNSVDVRRQHHFHIILDCFYSICHRRYFSCMKKYIE